MIFNGVSKPYLTVLRGRVRPFFTPLRREKKFDNKLVRTDQEHRIIEVPALIKYDNIPHFRGLTEDIAEWLVHDEPKILGFADEPDRLYFAVVDDTANEEFLYNRGTETKFTFICGYKYSQERQLTINNTLTSSVKGHKSTLWKTKTKFNTNQTGYELVFNAPGKTDLREINKIKLNYDFIQGDILEINYSKRRVTVNGKDITNTLVILQSNFMELPIGSVEFVASHPTEFYYHERYY